MRLLAFRILCFVLLSILLAGKANAQEEDLIGQWSVDLNRTLNSMTGTQRLQYDSMPDRMKESMRQAFQGRTFDFESDGRVVISFHFKGQNREIVGQWMYSAVDGELAIIADQERKTYDVHWETEDLIALRYKDLSEGGMLTSLSLVRHN